MSINLAEIEARAAKATAGKWAIEYGAVVTKHPDFQGISDGVFGAHSAICYTNDGEYIENSNYKADAEFIAHAREDVPALIKRLRKAEALLEEAQGYISESTEHQTYIDDKIDRYLFGGDE